MSGAPVTELSKAEVFAIMDTDPHFRRTIMAAINAGTLDPIELNVWLAFPDVPQGEERAAA